MDFRARGLASCMTVQIEVTHATLARLKRHQLEDEDWNDTIWRLTKPDGSQ
jgi:hypothetical protein